MQISALRVSPDREVYNPGDVLDVSIGLATPFVGQCEVGLVAPRAAVDGDARFTVFARSSDYLYEGQVHVRPEDVGTRSLVGRFVPVKGPPATMSLRDSIHVRPIRP